MGRRLKALGLASVILSGSAAWALADSIAAGEEHCVVNVRSDDRLNIRGKPSNDAPILKRKRYGECGVVVIGACNGAWCPAEDGHVKGWIHRHFISMVSPALYCVAGVPPGDFLNLRTWPSSQSRVLKRLPRHQCGIAFLPFARGSWQKIRVEGWQGWVNRKYLSGQ
jgi:SH3-like domain-containing protein